MPNLDEFKIVACCSGDCCPEILISRTHNTAAISDDFSQTAEMSLDAWQKLCEASTTFSKLFENNEGSAKVLVYKPDDGDFPLIYFAPKAGIKAQIALWTNKKSMVLMSVDQLIYLITESSNRLASVA